MKASFHDALIPGLCAAAWLGVLLVSLVGYSRPVAAVPSIAERDGLEIAYQRGKIGFPADVGPPSPVPTERNPGKTAARATVLAIADDVPYSSKAHVTVRYGATVFERRRGPVSVGSTSLAPYHDTVVLGIEGLRGTTSAAAFELRFDPATGPVVPFALLIRRNGGDAPLVFAHELSREHITKIVGAPLIALSQSTPLLTKSESNAIRFGVIERVGTTTHQFAVPLAVNDVRSAHLIFAPTQQRPIGIEFAGFVADHSALPLVEITAIGAVGSLRPVLEIRDEAGNLNTVYPDVAGVYRFARPAGIIFSAVFRTPQSVAYLPGGRWQSATQLLDGLTVDLAPDYVNAGAEINDIDKWRRSIKRSKIRSLYTTSYAPHTRGWWSGAAGKMTRFRGEYFTNNVGFHDIDVHPANPQQCLIGVYFDESLGEARQMRLYEKSSTILGEVLSVALGRCVIVHSIAAGKSIQSYEDIVRAAGDYEPTFFLFGLNPSAFMQITPLFQRHFYGYAPGFSPVGTFDLDESDELRYDTPAADWLEHRLAPKNILEDGTPLSAAFRVADERLPQASKRAWQMIRRLVQQYAHEFPRTRIVLDGAFEYARCATLGGCDMFGIRPAGDHDGGTGGGTFFELKMRQICDESGALCSFARDSSAAFSVERRQMVYENDFHYTRFGNYWLATVTAKNIASGLRPAALAE